MALAAGVRLITRARVFEVVTDAAGRATGVAYHDRDGIVQRHRAAVVALAANGLGTARLMLLPRSRRFPEGIANDSGMVGRRLMHHPTGLVTGVFPEPVEGHKGPFAVSILSQEFYETRAEHPLRRGYRMQPVRSDGPGGTACGGYLPRLSWGEGHRAAFRRTFGPSASLTVATGDLPDPGNRVTLSDRLTDSDGVPAPKMTCRVDANAWAMIEHGRARATAAFREAGAVETVAQRLLVHAGFHLLGTARMGDDPATSVVNAASRAHACPNLLVLDGSVFVIAAALNPTSTIQALALRAADLLVRDRRQAEVAA
jgi:choline dehydrogenase-like flavoprotein